jgi:hypothetical protein
MQQRALYVDKVDECSKVRREINDDLYKKGMNPLQKIAFYLCGISPREYKQIHDMNYYKGGYPNEDSPPKLHVFLDKFIAIIKWFQFLGWFDRIDSYLKKAGITITIAEPIINEEIHEDYKHDKKDYKKFIHAWTQLYPEQEPSNKFGTVFDVMNECLERSYDLQKDICDLADSIKIDGAKVVETECEILKPYFTKAVMLKYKETKNAKRGRDIKKDLQEVKSGIANLEDAISIFEK